MTWLRKMRPVLFAIGLALGIATLIGARSLTGGSGSDASAKPDAPTVRGGPVVLGLVDTDPSPVNYGLPPVLASGTVVAVHVKDGDEVQAGQKLYEFDATIQKQDVELAKAAVRYADTKVKEAVELAKQHTGNVDVAEKAVEFAEQNVELRKQAYGVVDANLEQLYKGEMTPPEKWAERKKSSVELYKANVEYHVAKNDLNLAKAKRDQLKTADPQVKVDEAKAAVDQAKAQQAKAQAAVDLCVVTAKTAGTVEQVTIGPGTTMGVGTRAPALWIIPAGPRAVRAELEAEFAHRVGPNLKGKTVTISDHTDPNLTYSGVVDRVPEVFLLKRASAENFLGGDTRVLEVVIKVTDPNPHGKPPLRVGQRVRVNLGQ
jgi:multidrug resistance efflux pump